MLKAAMLSSDIGFLVYGTIDLHNTLAGVCVLYA